MAMTASVMAGDRRRVLEAGFDAFQSKPINLKDFLAAVEELLERHRRLGTSKRGVRCTARWA
jgi:CheY-like chemotaxis protein